MNEARGGGGQGGREWGGGIEAMGGKNPNACKEISVFWESFWHGNLRKALAPNRRMRDWTSEKVEEEEEVEEEEKEEEKKEKDE